MGLGLDDRAGLAVLLARFPTGRVRRGVLAGAQEPDADEALGLVLGGLDERLDAVAPEVVAADLRVSADVDRSIIDPRVLKLGEPVTAERRVMPTHVRKHPIPDLAIRIGHGQTTSCCGSEPGGSRRAPR